MKKSKIAFSSTKIPTPFETVVYKTERTCVAKVAEWINGIIEKKGLDIGPAEVETRSTDDKYPDIIIRENPRSQDILCVAEFKPPFFDPFNEEELKEPARRKASHRKAEYFVTSNFKTLICFNTEKVNASKPGEEQIFDKYHLSELEDLNEIDEVSFSGPIKKGLESFLVRLYSVHSGKEATPKHPIDYFLVVRLQEKIKVLSTYYKRIIYDQCHKDSSFAKTLTDWFVEQGWNFTWQPNDFDKSARQTAYLLVNKILFYDLLQAKRPDKLDPLEIPESLTKGGLLQTTLQAYFKQVLDIDYETIYETDFIDSLAFPEAKEVVKEIKELIKVLRTYDFSKIGFDIIGKIFEQLIPLEERHNLGQYFTDPDIVDFILRFCVSHEDDRVLDPACGAGTFLVRAYQHKKLMNQRLEHENIIDTLWGNDIAKFPAHLSTINLAINDLGSDKNYPNILQEDFFTLIVGNQGFDLPEKYLKRLRRGLGKEKEEVAFPRWFDAIVGNPPYTRQEEIPKIGVDKEKLIENALKVGEKRIADISKRAGIHAYFFVHGTKFLKDGGYFGFIVSNSWLDVEYGKGLQEFFLQNYKVVAIIESKVERWFEEADINTCITILQKCRDKKERDENLVRFVYLKKPLRHFIPPAQDVWERQIERLNAVDNLKKTILAHNDFYENEELRIFPRSQKELWQEGFDKEEQKYAGAKWGKYLRAPEIFFRILEKGKGKLVPLKEVAKVRFGIKTGANEFFYLTEEEIKRKGIEKEFWMHKDRKGKWIPNYVIKSPQECKTVVIKPDALKYRVLIINKDKKKLRGKNISRYIAAGERRGFDKRETCAGRENWYYLGEREPGKILFAMIQAYRHIVFYNPSRVYPDHNLFEVLAKEKDLIFIAAWLSSAVTLLTKEVYGRSYGGGEWSFESRRN